MFPSKFFKGGPFLIKKHSCIIPSTAKNSKAFIELQLLTIKGYQYLTMNKVRFSILEIRHVHFKKILHIQLIIFKILQQPKAHL